ncbi:MAG: right-handed parallel beta-helix repeat-containing protein [Aliidongia sp.]
MTILSAMPVSPNAGATVLYVSAENGSDAADGLTPAAAFRTLEAGAERLQPGDRLIIGTGRYDGPLHLTRSGTPAAPIDIVGAEGPLPVIRSANDGVIVEADYVRLSRLDVASDSPLGSAIAIEPGHHHVTIADSVAHDSGCAGIAGIQTDYLTIRHNLVYGNGRHSPWQCSGISIYQAANSDEAPGFHNVIEGNRVYGNLNMVVDPKLPAAVAGHTTDGNGIILDDFRHDQIWQGRKTAPYRSASLIANNVAYDNGGRGIELFHSDDVTVINNTVRGNMLDPNVVPGRYGEIYLAFAARSQLFNNLVAADSSGRCAVMATNANAVEADYNVTIGGSPCRGRSIGEFAWGSHNFSAALAGFVDDRDHDLHLSAASPAVKRGSAAHAPAADLDNRPRPRTGSVDAGAYQFSR